MTAEPDESMEDEMVRNIVAELRRPVALDPAVDARVLDLIHARQSPDARRGWIASIAGAAIAAGVLLALFLGPLSSGSSQTRQVRLRISAPASRVVVVGDFNDWSPVATPLRPSPSPGVWTVELRLKPGRYHYSFLLDGRRWVSDPSEPRAAESDFGAPVSVLTVS